MVGSVVTQVFEISTVYKYANLFQTHDDFFLDKYLILALLLCRLNGPTLTDSTCWTILTHFGWVALWINFAQNSWHAYFGLDDMEAKNKAGIMSRLPRH